MPVAVNQSQRANFCQSWRTIFRMDFRIRCLRRTSCAQSFTGLVIAQARTPITKPIAQAVKRIANSKGFTPLLFPPKHNLSGGVVDDNFLRVPEVHAEVRGAERGHIVVMGFGRVLAAEAVKRFESEHGVYLPFCWGLFPLLYLNYTTFWAVCQVGKLHKLLRRSVAAFVQVAQRHFGILLMSILHKTTIKKLCKMHKHSESGSRRPHATRGPDVSLNTEPYGGKGLPRYATGTITCNLPCLRSSTPNSCLLYPRTKE